MKKIKRRATKDARGSTMFTEFEDTYGATVTIKMSSSVLKRGWIFVHGGSTGENNGAVHFNNQQAKMMIKALERFIKHF